MNGLLTGRPACIYGDSRGAGVFIPIMDAISLAVEVMLMQRTRHLSAEDLELLQYPLVGPMFVKDWVEFMPTLLPARALVEHDGASSARVRQLIITGLETGIYPQYAVFSHIGQGFLSPSMRPGAAGVPSQDVLLVGIGEVMNMASNLRANLSNPDKKIPLQDALTACFVLGQHLAWLCNDHASLEAVFKQRGTAPGRYLAAHAATGSGDLSIPGDCAADSHGGGGPPRVGEGEFAAPVDAGPEVPRKLPGGGGGANPQPGAPGPIHGAPAAGPDVKEGGQILWAPEGSGLEFLAPFAGHGGQGEPGNRAAKRQRLLERPGWCRAHA